MKNITTTLTVAILVFVATYFFLVNPANKDKKELEKLLDLTRTEFVSQTGKDGDVINTQKQSIASLENAVAAGIVDKEELKKLNLRQVQSIVKLEAEVRRLNLELSYDQPPVIITVPTDDIPEDYMRIPQNFTFQDDWTTMKGTIQKESILLNSLEINTQTSIFTGYKRQGFLKPAIPVVMVTSDNPYMNLTHLENIQITSKPPFYKRSWWHRLEGAALLYGASRLLNQIK